jgi:hypothetical protein
LRKNWTRAASGDWRRIWPTKPANVSCVAAVAAAPNRRVLLVTDAISKKKKKWQNELLEF